MRTYGRITVPAYTFTYALTLNNVASGVVGSSSPTNGSQWVGAPGPTTIPGVGSFNVQANGGIVDLFFAASGPFDSGAGLIGGGAIPASAFSGYMIRFDARAGFAVGQILRMDSGYWSNIGTQAEPVNAAALSGSHLVTFSVSPRNGFAIYVDGSLQCAAVDTKYALSGRSYMAAEVIAGSVISPAIVSSPTAKMWVEVTTDANGNNDLVYLTTLCQVLKLSLGESPFYANYGLPARQSVLQQVWPDYYVSLVQQTFAPYFAMLSISKQTGTTTPTYNVNVITHSGVSLNQVVQVPT